MDRYRADAVVTCDREDRLFSPGVVDVDAGRIVFVGTPEAAPDLPAGRRDRDIGGILLPGLVNAHCHSPMTLLRGAGDGLPLAEWLSQVIWPREGRLTGDDVYWGMLLACAEMLRNGVTSSCEMYFHPGAIARAVAESGMRAMITPAIILAPGFEELGSWSEQLDAVTAFHDSHDGGAGGRISCGFAAHSAYTLPLDALVATSARARDIGAVFHTHLAETRDECADLERKAGKSAAHVLADRGVFQAATIAAHGVWLGADDIDLLAENNVSVAHCPQSNAKLGSGIAPLARLTGAGVNVALGTDGPASNNNLDLWEEMRLALLLGSLRRAETGDPADATLPRPAGTLAMATRNGAAALGWDDLGSLEAGRQADMVRLDPGDPALTPVIEDGDLVSHLVWSADSRAVTDVWVAGEQVLADRQCTRLDLADARREVQLRAIRLASG